MPKFESLFLIGNAHRALPGHFPGRPVVPGVVVLDQVISLLATQIDIDAQLIDLPQVKFIEPLLPGQVARIEMEVEANRARFRVGRCATQDAGTVIASGGLQWRNVP